MCPAIQAIATVQSLGSRCTPLHDRGELYSALQQGVVDGAENNPPDCYLSRHYEIANTYPEDEHTFMPDIVIHPDQRFGNVNDSSSNAG